MDAQPGAAFGASVQLAGVAVLGGAHGTLALARSLGTRGVPVCVIGSSRHLASFSRHVERRIVSPGADDDAAVEFLLAAARRERLERYLLVPAGDSEVKLVSQFADRLSSAYRVVLPPWDRLKLVCDKPLLYRFARDLDIAVPTTYEFGSTDEAAGIRLSFPVVLKPSMGGNSRFARAKVVRANDRASFLAAFDEAAQDVGARNVVVQEMIPGGGEAQFSYAALWRHGAPVAEFTARRTRQFPVDFGLTSTFVEVVDAPQIAALARRVLAPIAYHGLVEIEFKHDSRDGRDKILDVNPRPWSWLGLAAAAGLDLGAMLWAVENGEPVAPAPARSNVSWMYLARDIVAAGTLISQRRLGMASYLRSLGNIGAWAAFSATDPLPGLTDMPLTAWRVLTRRLLKLA